MMTTLDTHPHDLPQSDEDPTVPLQIQTEVAGQLPEVASRPRRLVRAANALRKIFRRSAPQAEIETFEEEEEPATFYETSFSVNRSALKHLDAEATKVETERVQTHAYETALRGKRFNAYRAANPHARERMKQQVLAGYAQESKSQMETSLNAFRDEVVVALEAGHKLDLLAVCGAYEQICTNGQSGAHASGALRLALRSVTTNPDFFNPSGSDAFQAKGLLRTLYNIGALWDEKLILGVTSPVQGATSEYGQARFNIPTYTISWLPGQEALPQATIKIAREKGDGEKDAAWNVTAE